MIRLPVKQDGPHFEFSSELDGTAYTFEFRWNARDRGWYLTFGDGEGLAFVVGVKVVINHDLLKLASGEGLPAGTLIALDTGGTNTDPGYADLGRRVTINYLTLDDIAEIEAASS